MGFQVCGGQFRPSFFREMGTTVSNSVHHVFQSTRIYELCDYVSAALRANMAKVQQLFDSAKDLILLTCMSTIAAFLDPAPFFGSFAVGMVSNFLIEFMHGAPASGRTFFLERAYEEFIAQSALVSVNLGCKAIQSLNFQFFPHMWREGAVSSMIAGLIAGATVASAARRIYASVLGTVGMSRLPAVAQ